MATVETSVENETPEIVVIDLRKKGAEPIESVVRRYEDCRVMISSPRLKNYQPCWRFGLNSENHRNPIYDGTIV